MSTSTTGFVKWETAMAAMAAAAPVTLKPHRQRMLKTALLTVPLLYAVKREIQVADLPPRATDSAMQNYFGGSQQYSRGSREQSKHVKAERRRREGLNERFASLRRLVPFVTKPTKVSVLGDAIEYVVQLQRQVRELESTAKTSGSKKSVKQDVEVTVEKSMAIMKVSCAWQDGLLIDILHKLADLQLEVVDANAEVSNTTLNATLKAKVKGSDQGDEEKKSTEIQGALLIVIEGELQGKAVLR